MTSEFFVSRDGNILDTGVRVVKSGEIIVLGPCNNTGVAYFGIYIQHVYTNNIPWYNEEKNVRFFSITR